MNPGVSPVAFSLPETFAALLDTAAPEEGAREPATTITVAEHALVISVRRQAP